MRGEIPFLLESTRAEKKIESGTASISSIQEKRNILSKSFFASALTPSTLKQD